MLEQYEFYIHYSVQAATSGWPDEKREPLGPFADLELASSYSKARLNMGYLDVMIEIRPVSIRLEREAREREGRILEEEAKSMY